MTYCIDTSALIHGWSRAYPPKNFPKFWDRMDDLISQGKLIAPDEVLVELEKKDGDALHQWAKEREDMFYPLDGPLQAQVKTVLGQYPRLTGAMTGRNQADPFVIGLARLKKLKVVTQEGRGNGGTRPMIPDVCDGFKVPCMRLLDLIQECNWTF